MKTQFAVADVGTLLLLPERYDGKAEAEAALAAHGVTSPMYQVVELRFEDFKDQMHDRVAKVRENERARHEQHVADEAEMERKLTPEEREAREDKRLTQRRKELEADEAERAARKATKEQG